MSISLELLIYYSAFMSFIEVNNITKKFGTFTALENVSFKIEKGQIVALVGPNGSGKSTLAKILVGLDMQSSGTIKFRDDQSGEEKKLTVGYVPQHFDLDRTLPMTVFEFLHLSLPNYSSKKKETQTILTVLERVGVGDILSKQLGSLSGGQLQRVIIARVLLRPHDVLILDEPSAGIDVGGEEELYAILQKLNKEDATTMIIISHELDFVFRFADQVICVNQRLLCTGVPHKVLTEDILSELYGSHVGHYHHNCEQGPHHHHH